MLKRSAAMFRVILGFSHYASDGPWDDSIPLQNAFSILSPFGNRLRRLSKGAGLRKKTGAGCREHRRVLRTCMLRDNSGDYAPQRAAMCPH